MRAAPRAGLLAAMLTPMRAGGRAIDEAAVAPYVRWLAARGVGGVFVGGSTGEFLLLSGRERRRLLEAVLPPARAAGLSVVAHVGDATTAGARALARHAARAGADAMAAVTPWYYALGAQAVADHLAQIAGAAPDLPFFAYNLPAAARNRVTPAVIEALARRCPNLAGLKDSGGDLAQMRALAAAGRSARGGGFRVFCGTDALLLRALEEGVADGIVSGTASTAPEPFADLLRDRTAPRQDSADRAAAALGLGADLGLFKAALAARGMPVGPPRPPLAARSAEDGRRALREAGLDGRAMPPSPE